MHNCEKVLMFTWHSSKAFTDHCLTSRVHDQCYWPFQAGWERSLRENASMLSRFSPVQLFATPWTVAHQAPPSMGFSRHEYWSGLPFPFPGDLPDSGIEPRSAVAPALQAVSLPLSHQGSPGGRTDRRIPMAESFCDSSETITTLSVN